MQVAAVKEKRNIHIRIERETERDELLSYCRKTRQFINLLILLINDIYKSNLDSAKKRDYLFFLDPMIVRALVSNTTGGKKASKVQCAQQMYADQYYLKELLKVASELLPKNIYYSVKKLAVAYKSAFTKLQKGVHSGFPKPKKIKDTSVEIVMPIDQERFVFKGNGKLGINLGKGQTIFHINEKALLKVTPDFKSIKALEVITKHGEVYLSFTYEKTIVKIEPDQTKPIKYAGIDIGINNFASIFIFDKTSESIILKTPWLIAFNSRFNQKLSTLKSLDAKLRNKLGKMRDLLVKGLQESGITDGDDGSPGYYSENYLAKVSSDYLQMKQEQREASGVISKLFSRRQNRVSDYLRKMARRTLEVLAAQQVDKVFMSRNLGKITPNLGHVTNQKFVALPLMKFIDYLKLNAPEYGIEILDHVDEAYSSKASCFSDESDIMLAQELGVEKRALMCKKGAKEDKAISLAIKDLNQKISNACGGKRDRRSRYRNINPKTKRASYWHADLNGALNHIRIGLCGLIDTTWVHTTLFKLCRPQVIQCNGLFLDFGLNRPG